MNLLGIEMSLEEFDRLICEQNKGKELVIKNNKVVAIDHIETQQEKNLKRLNDLQEWFNNYFEKQFIQSLWQQNCCISSDPLFTDKDENKVVYKSIDELKMQGEKVRAEIKDLKKKLNIL